MDESNDGSSIFKDENKLLDDEEGLVDTIIEVSKLDDLSPRQADNLKEKKGRANIPLQIQTKSSKGRFVSCDQ